ncbi:hypothetical protein BT67DRAFT_140191 [Trichocladium antarcticum]|uniref:Uncharacterized protein n=1 Tax=Trichocladium antarcticum TaxID=1450529 RepID=A0AAN6UFV9_9PEZI|nr:hypothetical protein BT67DRAFT_140191 [Trichocladium antarcticum]
MTAAYQHGATSRRAAIRADHLAEPAADDHHNINLAWRCGPTSLLTSRTEISRAGEHHVGDDADREACREANGLGGDGCGTDTSMLAKHNEGRQELSSRIPTRPAVHAIARSLPANSGSVDGHLPFTLAVSASNVVRVDEYPRSQARKHQACGRLCAVEPRRAVLLIIQCTLAAEIRTNWQRCQMLAPESASCRRVRRRRTSHCVQIDYILGPGPHQPSAITHLQAPIQASCC